jgi:hypothetical protein
MGDRKQPTVAGLAESRHHAASQPLRLSVGLKSVMRNALCALTVRADPEISSGVLSESMHAAAEEHFGGAPAAERPLRIAGPFIRTSRAARPQAAGSADIKA